MAKKRLYLAYGSNLNLEQMHYRCPEADAIGIAELKDRRLLFRGSRTGSYLTVEKAEGFTVPVGVWEVSKADEAALDRYEGFPTFYYKEEMFVQVKDDVTGQTRRRKAFIYIMHENRPIGVPSSAYMQTCAEGYRDFGFDLGFLMDAYRKSLEDNI